MAPFTFQGGERVSQAKILKRVWLCGSGGVGARRRGIGTFGQCLARTTEVHFIFYNLDWIYFVLVRVGSQETFHFRFNMRLKRERLCGYSDM